MPSLGTPVFGVWQCGSLFFPREGCFPPEGVFSHVQGEVVCFVLFFLPPWTHVGPPQRISAEICTPESCSLMPLYPRILFPLAFASSPPHPLETLEVMCSHTVTLGHTRLYRVMPGQQQENHRPPGPHSPSTLKSMFLPHGTSQVKHVLPGGPPPSTDNTDFLPEEREEICASQDGLETYLPTVQDTFHGMETCSRMWMCVSQAEGPALPSTSPASPLHLRPSTQFLLTRQVGTDFRLTDCHGEVHT